MLEDGLVCDTSPVDTWYVGNCWFLGVYFFLYVNVHMHTYVMAGIVRSSQSVIHLVFRLLPSFGPGLVPIFRFQYTCTRCEESSKLLLSKRITVSQGRERTRFFKIETEKLVEW